MAMLETLRRLGYEVGSGVMIGIPGQTYGSVVAVDDILLFGALDLDMIGVGPYIAHPLTPLGDRSWMRDIPAEEQIPGDELTVYKVVALTRLVRPDANIPSTTALATINKVDGRELGLQRGANIVMPNLTPPHIGCATRSIQKRPASTEHRRNVSAAVAGAVSLPSAESSVKGPGGRGST